MIAARIYNGETAEQIGISQKAYASRKEILDLYLETASGGFDPKGYLVWLQADSAGDRGRGTDDRGRTTVVVGKKDHGCGCSSNHKMPSKAKMAKSLAGEIVKFARAGFKTVDQQTYRDRLAVCEACPALKSGKRCRVCGCYMVAKARLATTSCALGKWPDLPQPKAERV